MSTYKLPIGIRIPSLDEYPDGHNVHEINKKRDLANIAQGYKLTEVGDKKFTHFAEINIDADKIWDLFVSLSNALIGNSAYGIIGFKDEEPILSDFTEKEKILEIFSKYKFELANDGYIHFGIAYYDDEVLIEIYVTNFKYFQVWTGDKLGLIETLSKFKLLEQKGLNFIDEFPVVSEALSCEQINGIKHYSEVLSEIEKEFDLINSNIY